MYSYSILEGQSVRLLAILLTSVVLIGGTRADNKSAELEVVPMQILDSPHEYRYHIVSGRSGFKDVSCFAGFLGEEYKDYDGKCFPISLADKSFLLADCFVHDSIAYSCRLVKFKSNGTLDGSFQTPFTSDHDELMGSPQNAIKSIEDVKVSADGSISIEGSFISPLVGWNEKQANEATGGIGDEAGKEGIVVLTKDGKFKSFKIVKK